MSGYKELRNKAIETYLQTHTAAQTARHFGLTRERIRQIAKEYGFEMPITHNYSEEVKELVKMDINSRIYSDVEIAERRGASVSVVRAMRNRLGISPVGRKLKPIGCDACNTKHYALGMCKNCYARYSRRRLD